MKIPGKQRSTVQRTAEAIKRLGKTVPKTPVTKKRKPSTTLYTSGIGSLAKRCGDPENRPALSAFASAGRVCTILFLAGAFLASAGRRAEAGAVPDASIGLISTAEEKYRTRITFLDDELKAFEKKDYPYKGVSLDGYQDTCRVQDRLFLNARGGSEKDDDSLILALSLPDGTVEEYDPGRVNILSFCVADDCLYTVSNLNWECYADRMSLKDGTQTSVVSTEVILDSAAVSDGMLYSLGYDENYANCLFRVDFEQNQIEKLLTLECQDLPSFLVSYEGRLIYTCDGILWFYEISTGALEEVKLSGKDACHLNVCGDLLYIGYTDLHSDDGDSRVERYDLKKGCVTGSLDYSGPVLQIEPGDTAGQKVWICGYDNVTEYDFSGENGTPVRSVKLAMDGELYPGGFFPAEVG